MGIEAYRVDGLKKEIILLASTRVNLTLLHTNNEGADQPAHPLILDSDIDIRLLKSVVVKLPPCIISLL